MKILPNSAQNLHVLIAAKNIMIIPDYGGTKRNALTYRITHQKI
jgi:hypothetical protein